MRTLQERCKNHSSLRPNQEEYSWLIEIVVFIPTLMLRNSLGKSHSDDESDRSKTTNRWEKYAPNLITMIIKTFSGLPVKLDARTPENM